MQWCASLRWYSLASLRQRVRWCQFSYHHISSLFEISVDDYHWTGPCALVTSAAVEFAPISLIYQLIVWPTITLKSLLKNMFIVNLLFKRVSFFGKMTWPVAICCREWVFNTKICKSQYIVWKTTAVRAVLLRIRCKIHVSSRVRWHNRPHEERQRIRNSNEWLPNECYGQKKDTWLTEECSTAKSHFWVCCVDEKVFVESPRKQRWRDGPNDGLLEPPWPSSYITVVYLIIIGRLESHEESLVVVELAVWEIKLVCIHKNTNTSCQNFYEHILREINQPAQ